MIKGAHVVIQKSRRGSGQNDWGRVDAKIDTSLVGAEKAKKLEGMIDDFLAKAEEAISGQPALPYEPSAEDRARQNNAHANKPPKGQKKLPLPKGH